ncbi:MAG: hypothetical protein M3Y28_03395, partial [Armatimonadota bacterium]|nr:hypothetical protein [Armatimonadota bacterium]
TNAGRREIAVLASVLSARRGLANVFFWYVPVLLCCVLPALVGWLGPALGYFAPHHFASQSNLRHLLQPGLVASGLLCGSLFVLAFAADTVWSLRLVPLFFLGLFVAGFTGIVNDLYNPGAQVARVALVQTSIPVLVLIVLQAVAVAADPNGWGRWQLWRWIVAATGLFVAYALLHIG